MEYVTIALMAAVLALQVALLARRPPDNAERFERVERELREELSRVRTEIAARLHEGAQAQSGALDRLAASMGERLETIRASVDEKLHKTLEERLGRSFQAVSERLEQVHKGLGEMQGLAQGVGDLKRVLTNVKTRGSFGEIQLQSILEQLLTPQQYEKNAAVTPGGGERVEFALKMPGAGQGEHVLLPIDAKFPSESYHRLQDAYEAGDAAALALAGKELETFAKKAARDVRDKYIRPPHTTDFAIMFLPTEGLYAEALRRPGLAEALQRDYHVVLAGPTTLSALLNSLQMGFRTLAIEKRSSEVWKVLGEVKAEFTRFGEALDKTQNRIRQADKDIEELIGVRTRQMFQKLKSVETADVLGETRGAPGLGE
ncbi:MAG: DNA recombination protein RmuC [Oscillospiraceae bacterium]|jgi:DNA recombination protein RmuC|nr:DNA recombination protein RmuC [Oscillospiraceae bacterium]